MLLTRIKKIYENKNKQKNQTTKQPKNIEKELKKTNK